jgi:cellulose synthase/poly-beta-1,6-N-acetylglucosamine synthase-like glycosyltransferase
MLELYFAAISFYYFYFIIKLYFGIKKDTNIKNFEIESYPKISVIIPFRNEKENILRSLNCCEKLNYPEDKLEIIYINDFSDDGSDKLLKDNITKSYIKVINTIEANKNLSFKKRAITYAIDQSSGDIIVTTDADCTFDADWLQPFVKVFNDKNIGFVTGLVRFEYKDDLFTKMQALEFASLVITGGALINNNEPIMCNAANLAYRKKLFYEVGGYDGNLNISSGDDVYLMHKILKRGKHQILFLTDEKSVVTTNPTRNLKEFYNQRKRWASKSLYYNDSFLIAKLFLIFLFYFNFIILSGLSIFSFSYFILLISIWLLKILTESLVMFTGLLKFYKKDKILLRYLIIAEIFHIPYIILSAIGGAFGKFDWKGRILKK